MNELAKKHFDYAVEELERLNKCMIKGDEKYNNILKECKKHVIYSLLIDQNFMNFKENNQKDSDFWIKFYSNVRHKNDLYNNSQIIINFQNNKEEVIKHLDLENLFFNK